MTFLCKLFGHKWGKRQVAVFVSMRGDGVIRETKTECLRCPEKRVSSRIEPLPDHHVVAE